MYHNGSNMGTMDMLTEMQFDIQDLNWLLRVVQIFGRQTFPISR